MSSDITTRQSKKIRILIATGAAVVLAGLVLHWNAKPLARKPVSPNVSTIDESYKESIQHLGDNIFWVGLALIVVGSFAWVNQTAEKQ